MQNSNDDLQDSSGPKPMMGIRVPARTKQELSNEANDLGITLSEHTENILLNRHIAPQELIVAKKELENANLKTEEVNKQFEKFKCQNSEQVEKYKMEVLRQAKEITGLKEVAALLNDKRLLQLFTDVKGKKDEIENANGKNFVLTYNNPKDLLTGMIYSYKLKKQ